MEAIDLKSMSKRKRYYYKHKEEVSERASIYYVEHREELLARAKAYYHANKAKLAEKRKLEKKMQNSS